MNFFLLLVRPSGAPISEQVLAHHLGAMCCHGLELAWNRIGAAAVLVHTHGDDRRSLGPSMALYGSSIGVGTLRLDNRDELKRRIRCHDPLGSDLELVMRFLALEGPGAVSAVLGDFAFATWNSATRELVAARDAFGVKKLAIREFPDLVGVASRPELLGIDEDYDQRVLVEHAAGCLLSPDRTVFAGVRAVPPAGLACLRHGRLEVRSYWSPETFEPVPVETRRQAACIDAFRELFVQAVRQRLTGEPDTWCQLSGGLDSSSVVSVAQWLSTHGAIRQGVAGTLSWVYRWDTDEREFSSAVARAWQVRNEEMIGDWLWASDGAPPPLTDEPGPDYPMYARERRTCSLVRSAGGRVLLTGMAGDALLTGNMFFFADWMVQGRTGDACREMLRRAALGRVSFWTLAYHNALLPLCPRPLQRALLPGSKLPPWIIPATARRVGLHDSAVVAPYAGRLGRKYFGAVLDGMRAIPLTLSRYNMVEEALDVRHPFLHRPLVEYCLRLPPEMCVQPHARKWILREALRGILPEPVRTRIGKRETPTVMLRSLVQERPAIEALIAHSVLADAGCIDPRQLRTAYDAACTTGSVTLALDVLFTIALETWLQARRGRWMARTDRSGSPVAGSTTKVGGSRRNPVVHT